MCDLDLGRRRRLCFDTLETNEEQKEWCFYLQRWRTLSHFLWGTYFYIKKKCAIVVKHIPTDLNEEALSFWTNPQESGFFNLKLLIILSTRYCKSTPFGGIFFLLCKFFSNQSNIKNLNMYPPPFFLVH